MVDFLFLWLIFDFVSVGVCGIRGRKNMRGRVSFADEEEREKKGVNQKLLKYKMHMLQ